MAEHRKRNHAAPQRRLNLGWLFVVLVLAAGVAVVWSIAQQSAGPRADPSDARQVALGKTVYDKHCAACHGANLEGQPRWQSRLPSGRMPAPPHDASGHTWHHPDELLFGMTKHGIVPGKYAPPGYESDMPAFAGTLTDDEIWAVLAYIKSRWPPEIQRAQRERRHAMR
ncbi:MAG: c-type cytochrome [Burkholderiales bacterium]|nr:c-type cytochrome [Burkholderiales bacterium]